MTDKTTSVTVDFGVGDSEENSYTWEEDSTKVVEPTTYTFLDATAEAVKSVWLRLYPKVGSPVVKVTSGSISLKSSGSSRKRDLLSFAGEDIQSIDPGASSVTISVIGRVYNASGLAVTVQFAYDSNTGEVRASIPCYGVVQVDYTSYYFLYMYTFSGRCPYVKQDDEDFIGGGSLGTSGSGVEDEREDEPFDSAVVWAFDAATQRSGTTTLNSPSCSYQYQDYSTSPGSVQISSEWSGLESNDEGEVTPVTYFRVNPQGSEVYADSRPLWRVDVGGPVTVEAVMNIGGSSSLAFYPHNNVVMTTMRSSMAAEFGDGKYYPRASGVSVPGNIVLTASWETSRKYKVTGRRRVGPQELVLHTSDNIMVPGQVMADVKYAYTYDVYKVIHPKASDDSDDADAGRTHATVVVTAKKGRAVGLASFAAPSVLDKSKPR